MHTFNCWTRRSFIQNSILGAAGLYTLRSDVFAEELLKTPPQAEGPFYPDVLPLDTDNDLIRVNDRITPAVGEITHLTGRVLDRSGEPVRNAVVEIWQVDNQANYIHTRGGGDQADKNFQGFGRFLTGPSGAYYFRTIKPPAYPGRPAHIHYAVYQNDKRVLTTQLYVAGDAKLASDRLYLREKDPKARQTLAVDFKPIKESNIGELEAHFDVVLG
ncbi:MAG: protocatechuate 3,4-dioxygenase beta subunit [Kiritimatiellia bacterium]|jgi:protocatechuate 3,4-dioxygenase beta subunit